MAKASESAEAHRYKMMVGTECDSQITSPRS
jgi:hypothetical protein